MVVGAVASLAAAGPSAAEDDARTKQLRLLCTQLSGDLTEPGGLAAFRRCMTRDPVGAMKDNAFGGRPPPGVSPPPGHGRNTRQLLASAVTQFQVVGANVLYIVVTDRKLWRQTIGTTDGKAVASNVAAFQALADGRLYVQTDDGRLWLGGERASAEQPVAEGVAAFHVTATGSLYVLGRDRALWRNRGPARTLVDSEVTGFQAIDDTVVDVLTADGTLWRETGTREHREQLASGITYFREVGDAMYVLTAPDRTLWRKTASGPEKVDAQVAWFQPIDRSLVYVLGQDGLLWREHGNQRELVDSEVVPQPGAFQAADATRVYVLASDNRLWAESMPPAR
jgi:hypothetical protein